MDILFNHIILTFFAILFAQASMHKFRDNKKFTRELTDYQLLPSSLIYPAARLIPVIELSVALLLFTKQPMAILGACSLLMIYAGAIGINLLRGRRHIDCGCHGPAATAQTINGWLVGRNLLLAAILLLCLLPEQTRAIVALDYFTYAMGTLALWLIYQAAEQGLANQQSRLAYLKLTHAEKVTN